METRIEDINEETVKLSDFVDLKTQVQDMFEGLNALERQSRTWNVRVFGIPETGGEIPLETVNSSLSYRVERLCKLTQVGGLLNSNGYGIAVSKGSPLREVLSSTILQLKENGTIHMLMTKWWQQKRGGGKCREQSASTGGKANELGLANVGGVFVVLIGGAGIAVVLAAFEFLWESRQISVEEGESVWTEMARELKFALKCRGSTKPTKKGAGGSGNASHKSLSNLNIS
ncbi:unnamed protein product [Cyprideis torosa]|uniref:Uncharacterized protein n=1 Tax=Cyprideis torosa TaxID=163714 RepID=A0A7R8WC28_9CRUS|nr:unnamed protein product [Cyprideis torosa]CAG0887090.1 unnamed protein product [Cyprideis torosa]